MSSNAKARHPISVADYLQSEQESEIRHEYIDGQVYAMVGASDRHGLILNALAFALTPAVRKNRCQLFTSDMKLQLEFARQTVFYYPDLILVCDPSDREIYFRTKPCLIVEVLSASTERIDRHEKFLAYQTLPSLREYLLISQSVRHIEIYRRSLDWQAESAGSGAIRLDCLKIDLSLDAIYADVNL